MSIGPPRVLRGQARSSPRLYFCRDGAMLAHTKKRGGPAMDRRTIGATKKGTEGTMPFLIPSVPFNGRFLLKNKDKK